MTVSAAPQQPAELLAAPVDGTSTFWPSAQHRRPGQVAHGEPVRVGGHQAQPVVLGGQQHAGEDRAGVVGARRRHHLAQRLGEGSAASRVTESLGRARAAAGTRRPGCGAPRTASDPPLMWASSSSTSTVDRAGLERPHDVGGQLGRQDHGTPSPSPPTCGSTEMVRSRSLPVSCELVAGQLEPEAGQHRQGAAPAGDGTAGGAPAPRPGRHVRIGTSRRARFLVLRTRCRFWSVVVVGAVDCGQRRRSGWSGHWRVVRGPTGCPQPPTGSHDVRAERGG